MATGAPTVVRAQRLPKEPRALVIVQREDRTRVIWHKNFSKYRIDMDETEWYLDPFRYVYSIPTLKMNVLT